MDRVVRDFCLAQYRLYLNCLLDNYKSVVFREFAQSGYNSIVVLRHDVDRKPEKALKMAEIEHSLGIRASYYFRDVPESLYPGVITKIAAMGHEIGYHYENLSVCALKLRIKKEKLREINAERISIESDHETRTLFECAIKDFKHSLGKLKKLAPISTIAMHGRPGVPIDNRLLWKVYDYRSFGIIAEPYFNVDYNEVLYITDAGRTWFDPKANQRDKVDSKYEFVFHSTDEIIQAINSKQLPSKMIINIHPEHWADNTIEWYKIKMVRSTRNLIKRIIL